MKKMNVKSHQSAPRNLIKFWDVAKEVVFMDVSFTETTQLSQLLLENIYLWTDNGTTGIEDYQSKLLPRVKSPNYTLKSLGIKVP